MSFFSVCHFGIKLMSLLLHKYLSYKNTTKIFQFCIFMAHCCCYISDKHHKLHWDELEQTDLEHGWIQWGILIHSDNIQYKIPWLSNHRQINLILKKPIKERGFLKETAELLMESKDNVKTSASSWSKKERKKRRNYSSDTVTLHCSFHNRSSFTSWKKICNFCKFVINRC